MNQQTKAYRALRLFTTFTKAGSLSFGGGYAMLPLIEREVVEKRHWMSHTEMLDIIGVSQAAPGAIAVNIATSVGYRVAGLPGCAAALLGVAWPSLLLMCAVALFFHRFRELTWVGYAFEGARAGVVVLIIGAMRRLCRKLHATVFNITLGTAAFAATALCKVSAAWVMLAALLIAWSLDTFARNKKEAPKNV